MVVHNLGRLVRYRSSLAWLAQRDRVEDCCCCHLEADIRSLTGIAQFSIFRDSRPQCPEKHLFLAAVHLHQRIR